MRLNTSVTGTELIELQGECFCILHSLFLFFILISGTFLVFINYINNWILQNIWDVRIPVCFISVFKLNI